VRHTSFCDYALYQVGWFSCVLGAAAQHPWIGFLVAVILIGVHLALSLERCLEARLIAEASRILRVLSAVRWPRG